MITKTTFKRSIDALDISVDEISNQLTDIRTDGFSTNHETTLNWTKDHGVDPGVMLYLREKLVSLAKRTPARIEGCKIVAIGGGKGGSGTTTIVTMLACLAYRLGYSVKLACRPSNLEKNQRVAIRLRSPISYEALNVSNLKNIKEQAQHSCDLLFNDFERCLLMSEDLDQKLDLHSIDSIVIPCNPFMWLCMDPAWRAAENLKSCGYEKFTLLPAVNRLDVSVGVKHPIGNQDKNFKKFKEKFSDTIIFLRHLMYSDVNFEFSLNRSSILIDEDLTEQYEVLNREVLRPLVMNRDDLDVTLDMVDKMRIEELLAYLKY